MKFECLLIQATLEKKKMVRGGIGIIHFVLSVPFPCIFDNVQDSSPPESCFLSVELLTPTSNDCESKIAAVQSCAYPIKRTTWNINHSFTIQHIDNGGYELLRDYTIRYRTNFQNMTRNMLLWNNIDLPEIKVLLYNFFNTIVIKKIISIYSFKRIVNIK